MRLVTKFLSVITVFLSLTGIARTDAGGILFDWQPFVVNDNLKLGQPRNDFLPKDLFVSEAMLAEINGINGLLQNNGKTATDSPDGTTKKSALSKIKVTFSPGNSFMLPNDEIYLRGKEGKFTQASRTISSFLRTPSQDMAVETFKLFEPQINLGFEF
ncbi:MAG: hypothetical protein CVU54_16120 [Deltaproteobacteria bacterium HGW-Deltaproteobacteria-12]|jgi:hypothetical protein|nr:MAG: hypothetical protein CVU54_16120 [Deltaproteobacteria bacterium HGW-Deltaproteobacteria-12]